jgi:KDO2-lipid IV(A) lauroyltransferase
MAILYFLFYYLLLIPLSYLPYKVLYLISDFLYVLLFYIFGYRKKVVVRNLRNSFPDKSKEELDEIMRKFYHHLSDIIIESLAIFTISRKTVHDRMKYIPNETVQRYYEDNRSIIISGGHYNSWELFALAVDDVIPHQSIGIYTALSNRFFDNKMKKSREKYGIEMISTREIIHNLAQRTHELTAPIFAIDQSPGNPRKSYWLRFLHQDTAVAFGTEKVAKKYNLPVYYCRINKIKRGYYTFELELVSDNPVDTDHGFITKQVTAMLEQDIINEPEYWLWSHRRWKHTKPTDLSNQ